MQVANISYNSEDESLSISEFQETLVSKIHSDTNSTKLKLESVTVDWLNDGVYICVKTSKIADNQTVDSSQQQQDSWSLVLCDLTLERCRLIRLHLNVQPKHLTADPFHGYLFWTEREGDRDNIYRANLETWSSQSSPKCSLVSQASQNGSGLINTKNMHIVCEKYISNHRL